MAINPNFVFADPALQAQVVNAQQVQAAAEAARAQQMAETLRALRADRQAQADREERRADRAAELARLNANEAERRRQFDVQTGLTREDIASKEKIAGGHSRESDERELYNNLLSFIDSTEEIPTASEWEARIVDVNDLRKKELRNRREMRFKKAEKDFNLVNGEVNRLNGKLARKEKDDKGNPWTAESLRASSVLKNNILIDPESGLLRHTLTQPRSDAAPETPTFHVPIGRPPPDTYGPAGEPISDVLGRVRGTGGNPAAAYGLGGALRRFFAPNPLQQQAGDGAIFTPPPSAQPPPFAPSARMLGNQGVLAPLDYSGPEYDYSSTFRVPEPLPQDFLAPPVFAPAY